MAETGNLQAEQTHVDEHGEFHSAEQPAAGAEGGTTEWICAKCGNANYSHRSVCNMRKCRHPRDGDVNVNHAHGGEIRKRDSDDGDDRGKRGKMGENWACKKCGNENFASRTHCNMRKCREPRDEWLCGSCGNLNFKYRMVCNMRKCGAAKPQTMGGMGGQGMGGMGMGMGGMGGGRGFQQGGMGGQGQYGTEATANAMAAYSAAAYGMGAGGEGGLDAYGYNQFMMGQNPYMGFPAAGGQQQGGGHHGGGGGGGAHQQGGNRRQPQERKEGDWACEKCGNFNYASRTKCNMRNCQELRKDI